MEWKQAIPAFRKTIGSRLKRDGFIYMGQNLWERPYGHWRGQISFEINPTNRGQSRRIALFTTLCRSIRRSATELLEYGERQPPGFTTYQFYTIWFLRKGPVEERIENVEELAPFAETVLRRIEDEWLPWLAATSESQGDSLEGAHRHTEHVHPQVTCVP